MREFVQLPMKTTLTGWPGQRLAAFETHIGKSLRQRFALAADRKRSTAPESRR